jgi:peptidoglycan/xylan/chitin deacetylase (PgdA/CDA1 family)
MIRFFRLPWFFRVLFPEAVFRLESNAGKTVCLTFDDGPDPIATPAILRILGDHGVKAIFFCTGRNVEKYPELFREIIAEGHQVGNHGYLHIKGLRTRVPAYLENAEKGSLITNSSLFRPPYGSISKREYNLLRQRNKIVFWDLMVYDFDRSFRKGGPLSTLKRLVRPGSVIVLHDNSRSCAGEFLDEAITFLKSEGYRFSLISNL